MWLFFRVCFIFIHLLRDFAEGGHNRIEMVQVTLLESS